MSHRGHFTSTDHIHSVSYYSFPAKGNKPKAVIQLSHGMCDYTGRYKEMIDFLTMHGYSVYSHNHIGHKDSVREDSELGYFGKKDGWRILVQDMAKLTDHIKKMHPNLPIILLGHSMGSFLSRIYTLAYSDKINALILLGTTGYQPVVKPGRLLIRIIRRLEGDRQRSYLLYLLSFGSYCSRITRSVTLYDWVSTDRKTVNRFATDPYCTFIFTNAGMMDLTKMLSICSSKLWFRRYPKKLPLLLASGSEDPVGQYGKGVTQVYHNLCAQNVTPLTLKLYTGERHELFTGSQRKLFFNDLLVWLDTTVASL